MEETKSLSETPFLLRCCFRLSATALHPGEVPHGVAEEASAALAAAPSVAVALPARGKFLILNF